LGVITTSAVALIGIDASMCKVNITAVSRGCTEFSENRAAIGRDQPPAATGSFWPIVACRQGQKNDLERFVSIEKTQPKVEKATIDVDA